MKGLSLPVALATSVGSLPHRDAVAAARFVLDRPGWLPAAPQLPRRSPLEGMVAQAAWGIQGVEVHEDGSLAVSSPDLDPDAPVGDLRFAGEPFVGLRAFLDAVEQREGPRKVQLTGPVTLGLALVGLDVEPALALDVATAAVRARALALVELVETRAGPGTSVVFLDEPGLVSMMHPGFPFPPDRAVDAISAVLADIEADAVTGLHCCGSTDWRLALQSGPQVVSAPVQSNIGAFAGTIATFLEAGGWIAWGAVPTDEPIGSNGNRLWRRLSDLWCDLVGAGCDPGMVREHAMVTPACGLAGHGLTQADHVLAITGEIASRLRDQAIGVRLSIGA